MEDDKTHKNIINKRKEAVNSVGEFVSLRFWKFF